MKKLVYLITLVLLIASCTKKDSFLYEEKAALNFNPGSNFQTVFNFATKYDPQSPAWDRSFYGDSLTSDTLVFQVDLLGVPGEVDRKYYLTTVALEGQDSMDAPDITFLNPYVLKANKFRDTIKIVINRPGKRGVFATGVTFDFEKSTGVFEKGVKELSVLRFEISDRYTQPEGWNEYYFGKYSEEKYAFFITVLNVEYISWMEWMFGPYQQTLKKRLKQFNDEHPDNPKDFTFPG